MGLGPILDILFAHQAAGGGGIIEENFDNRNVS